MNFPTFPPAALPPFVNEHLGWFLFGLIVLAGVVVGFRDMLRLSPRRISAIAGVCWSESVRRRVLWITPLAMLGAIVVSQLQRPIDEQDAIRQTVKFCLFATGLVVAVTTIILACTNLPREIDNRVIFTVVTKPTTRLDIVLGKIVGFALVSLTILAIMGAFSWTYLSLRAWNMQRDVARRLESKDVPAASVATLEYYRDAGLLNARKVETPGGVEVFARSPYDTGSRRFFMGGMEGSFSVRYQIDPAAITPPGETTTPGQNGLIVVAHVGYERLGPGGAMADPAASPATAPATAPAATAPATVAAGGATTGPSTVPYYGPFVMPPEQREALMAGRTSKRADAPLVVVEVLDGFQNSIGTAVPIGGAREIALDGPPGRLQTVTALIPSQLARQLKGPIYLRVTGATAGNNYFVDPQQTPVPIALAVPGVPGEQWNPSVPVAPIEPVKPDDASRPVASASDAAVVEFQSRSGTFGMQLRGGAAANVPVGIYRFRDVSFDADNEAAPFELRSGIERSEPEGVELDSTQPTEVAVRVRNVASGQLSDEVIVRPESRRTVFFRVPASALAGGNFDVLLQTRTLGDFVGLEPRSLVLITARQPFAWNLGKSLLILWLMAILVTSISIFTSTFLSWPIAVVLTLVILLGHWGVQQLGDATAPGIGAQVVTDFGLKNPAKAEAVRATVERLSSFLNFISTILPDISRFAAVEDIERGIAIPAIKLWQSAAVALGFGLPLALLAYVFLKNKEVAP